METNSMCTEWTTRDIIHYTANTAVYVIHNKRLILRSFIIHLVLCAAANIGNLLRHPYQINDDLQ